MPRISLSTSLSHLSIRNRSIWGYTNQNFQTGAVKVNGYSIEIKDTYSLGTVAYVFNQRSNLTNVQARIMNGQLCLFTKDNKISIDDSKDGVLSNYYNNGGIGTEKNNEIRIISSQAREIKIKYQPLSIKPLLITHYSKPAEVKIITGFVPPPRPNNSILSVKKTKVGTDYSSIDTPPTHIHQPSSDSVFGHWGKGGSLESVGYKAPLNLVPTFLLEEEEQKYPEEETTTPLKPYPQPKTPQARALSAPFADVWPASTWESLVSLESEEKLASTGTPPPKDEPEISLTSPSFRTEEEQKEILWLKADYEELSTRAQELNNSINTLEAAVEERENSLDECSAILKSAPDNIKISEMQNNTHSQAQKVLTEIRKNPKHDYIMYGVTSLDSFENSIKLANELNKEAIETDSDELVEAVKKFNQLIDNHTNELKKWLCADYKNKIWNDMFSSAPRDFFTMSAADRYYSLNQLADSFNLQIDKNKRITKEAVKDIEKEINDLSTKIKHTIDELNYVKKDKEDIISRLKREFELPNEEIVEMTASE